MKTKTVIPRHTRMLKVALWAALLAGTVLVRPLSALALESASYRLYDTLPNDGTPGGGDTSASYLLNENGITWLELPITSTNYLIVTAPPSVSSSSSSESSSAGGSSSATAQRQTGGHRGSGTSPSKPAPSIPGAPGRRPAAPRQPSTPGMQPGRGAPSVPIGGATIQWKRVSPRRDGQELLHPSATFRIIDQPWGSHYRLRGWSSFLRASLVGVGGEGESVHFEWFGLLCAILEGLLLWRIHHYHRLTASSRRRR